MPSSSELPDSNWNEELKIEFDGTTVLCRVCGDKASGFHYGVHSCEGCKGFFRRSIQQKIQYRPCTKNQQCSILRINRNRCQYCRLKKCIAVGMSRDAVRFGRVPKREKAKILAAMQKVNMSSMEKQLNEQLDDEGRLLSSLLAAHDETCDYTRDKVAPLLDRARAHPVFASCPSSMACPLNPIPQHVTDPNGGGRILEDFSERFSPAIRGVVEFAKRIPGFNLLSQDDQVTLLKAGVFEVLLVRLACMFDSQTNSMICLNGLVLRRESLNSASNARFLMDSMFDFAERLNNLGLSDHEIGLFCAVVVIAPDRPGLRNTDLVQKIHRKLDVLLQKSISSNHPDNPGLFTELKKKIPDLRTLNTLHSEKLLAYKMEPRNGGPLHSMPHNGAMMPERWSLNGHPSPNGSDWSGDSKELQDVNYGSPRSVSSSVASSSAEDMKSPQRSGSVSSGKSGFSSSERPYSPGRISSCPKRQSLSSSSTSSCPSKNVSSTTNGHVNGQSSSHSENGCSSGDESYFANDSPTTNSKAAHSPSTNGTTATKLKRVDSPTDSGIESGKEHTQSTPTTSVCSSPRSAMDEKVKDVSQSLSDVEGGSHHPSDDAMTDNGHSDSIDDMPMLKRALQAPPLVSPHMLMDEAYRHHKKFRAVKRDPSPSTTTPCESLAAKHTTLVKTLEAAPRYFTEAQLKRTDLIQNIIMRSDQSSPTILGGESSNRPIVPSHFPLQHQALTGKRTTDNPPPPPTHGYYIPTSYGTTNGCQYTSNGRTPVPVTPRIMYSGPSSSSMVHHSNGDVIHTNGLTNSVVIGQRRSPVVVGTTSSLSPHHHHSSALVMGGTMSPASLKSTSVSVLSHSPSLSVTRSPPSPAAIKQLSQSHHHHNTLPTDTLSDNLQPLNLSMSKRASAPNSPTATPPVVKMET